MKLAIYAITVNGAKKAERLKKALPFADLYLSESTKSSNEQALPLVMPMSDFVAEKFSHYDGHIFICATGIVTRVISPLLMDKRSDPAVVCVDEQGRFAISMLSGHRGGANELTQRVAHIVKATPVITTASDVQENVSVDMLGAPFGWVLDPISEPSITKVSAAVVNDEPMIIAQQAGDKNWWQYDKRMPANILCHTSLDNLDSESYQGAILISDQVQTNYPGWENKLVLWRPKSLLLGIGCDRNTPLTTLNAGLQAFSQQFGLSLDSVAAMASIDLKADEQGLIALSQQRQWPFITYAASELDVVEGIENPSDYVKKVTGSRSVAEAAALKQSNQTQLLVAKWAFKQDGYNMTIACCRREFSESLVQQKRKNWLGEKKHGSDERHGEKSRIELTQGADEIRVNAYGNEVVEGYVCKPKHVDLDRPMLHYRHHLLLCEGKRCAKAGSKNLAHSLRGVLKELDLNRGAKRIKISRTQCAGACRNRSTLVIYERPLTEEYSTNHACWLRNVEDLSEQEWREMFVALSESRPIQEVIDQRYFAAVMQEQEEKLGG